ncbi:MAG: glycoside hydrolase family 11 protein [Spirochaetales bacterium]|nr:glycoside hydrolase family 11 protein [Spirochaetales bacterium]
MKRNIMKSSVLLALVFLLFCQCSSQNAVNIDKLDPGVVAVQISTDPELELQDMTVYLKLYAGDVNIYHPDTKPLAQATAVLDAEAKTTGIFEYTAADNTEYQVTALVNGSGQQGVGLNSLDLYLYEKTGKKSGALVVSLDMEDAVKIRSLKGRSFAEAVSETHHMRIWQADSWKGSNSLGVVGDAEQVVFSFDGTGGAIGRVGKIYSSLSEGWVRVDDIDDTPVNVDARIEYSGPRDSYFFGIYGWVMDGKGWDASKVKDEFYVIEKTDIRESDPLIGTLEVDGVTYNMHRYKFPDSFKDHNYRFKAIRTTDQRTTGPINMKPFFEYWRANGMENNYLDEVSWLIELISGSHKGSITLWNIDLPVYK